MLVIDLSLVETEIWQPLLGSAKGEDESLRHSCSDQFHLFAYI